LPHLTRKGKERRGDLRKKQRNRGDLERLGELKKGNSFQENRKGGWGKREKSKKIGSGGKK